MNFMLMWWNGRVGHWCKCYNGNRADVFKPSYIRLFIPLVTWFLRMMFRGIWIFKNSYISMTDGEFLHVSWKLNNIIRYSENKLLRFGCGTMHILILVTKDIVCVSGYMIDWQGMLFANDMKSHRCHCHWIWYCTSQYHTWRHRLSWHPWWLVAYIVHGTGKW